MKHPQSIVIDPLTRSIRELSRYYVVSAFFVPFVLTIASGEEVVQRRPVSEPVERVASPRTSAESAPAKSEARSSDETIRLGLEFLIKHQQSDGGWGQGGGWRQNLKHDGTRVEGADVEDPSDLGNTCVSLVTLLRAGHSPASGNYRENAAKAFDFVCRFVEKADGDSLYVTPVRDTQLQVKIGTYVDTFLAGWVLSELKGKLPDEAAETRRAAALDKVVRKIERNQKEDGSFAGNSGWAAVLSQGLCSKALNTAARSGAKVSQSALDKDQRQNTQGLDIAKGDFTAPASPTAEPSSAGVSLYRETSKLGGLFENRKSNVARRQKAEKVLADDSASKPAKEQAQADLDKIESDDKAAQTAVQAVGGKLANDRFVAGFGNNGGEEFLSYMNVSESLREHGGKEWDDWKPKMRVTVCGAQNADGSWSGHHCITGRTFCTGAALLTLLSGEESAKVTNSDPAPSVTPASDVKIVEKTAGVDATSQSEQAVK